MTGRVKISIRASVWWLVKLTKEMGQWLVWMGLLVPQIQAHACCQGTCVDVDAGKASQGDCMDLGFTILQH